MLRLGFLWGSPQTSGAMIRLASGGVFIIKGVKLCRGWRGLLAWVSLFILTA